MDNFVKLLVVGTLVYAIVSAASSTCERIKYGKNGEKYLNRRNRDGTEDKNP